MGLSGIKGFIVLLSVFFIFEPLPVSALNKKLTVVYTEWFPYTYTENSSASGFEIDVVRAVASRMGLEVSFESFPWKRCLLNMKSGKADMIVSLLRSPEREEYILFPDEYISVSRTVFFTLADSAVTYTGSFDSLKNYTIGVIDGFIYGDKFDHAVYLKKDTAINAEMLISKLLYKRNDLAAENQAVIIAYASRMGVSDRIRFLDPPIHTQKLYVGFSSEKSKKEEMKKLCTDFSRGLSEFRKTDAYSNILIKYGINPELMK